MGIFKHLFRHPFGKHSLFHTATHNPLLGIVAGAVLPPLAGLTAVSKLKSMVTGGEAVFRTVRGAVAGTHGLLPHGEPQAMPGGARAAGVAPHHRSHRTKGTVSRGRSVRRRQHARGR